MAHKQQGSDPPTPSLEALHAITARLASLAPPPPPAPDGEGDAPPPPPPSALDTAIAGLHDWLVSLTQLVRPLPLPSLPRRVTRGRTVRGLRDRSRAPSSLPTRDVDLLSPGAHALTLLFHSHPTQGDKPPDARSNLPALLREKHLSFSVPRGAETGEGSDGAKVVAVLEAVRGLLDWVLERVFDRNAGDEAVRGWRRVLLALLLGLEVRIPSSLPRLRAICRSGADMCLW